MCHRQFDDDDDEVWNILRNSLQQAEEDEEENLHQVEENEQRNEENEKESDETKDGSAANGSPSSSSSSSLSSSSRVCSLCSISSLYKIFTVRRNCILCRYRRRRGYILTERVRDCVVRLDDECEKNVVDMIELEADASGPDANDAVADRVAFVVARTMRLFTYENGAVVFDLWKVKNVPARKRLLLNLYAFISVVHDQAPGHLVDVTAACGSSTRLAGFFFGLQAMTATMRYALTTSVVGCACCGDGTRVDGKLDPFVAFGYAIERIFQRADGIVVDKRKYDDDLTVDNNCVGETSSVPLTAFPFLNLCCVTNTNSSGNNNNNNNDGKVDRKIAIRIDGCYICNRKSNAEYLGDVYLRLLRIVAVLIIVSDINNFMHYI